MCIVEPSLLGAVASCPRCGVRRGERIVIAHETHPHARVGVVSIVGGGQRRSEAVESGWR